MSVRLLVLTIPLLLLGASGVSAQGNKGSLLERAGMSRARGQQSAPVTVMEISDFQCPYCGRFAREVFPRIDSAFVKTGKVQWVFVNLPLPNHHNAWLAAEAALCAGGTGGGFWPMHDQLFEGQAEWSGPGDPAAHFRRYARQAGVALAAYDACVAGDRTATLVLQDLLYAASLRLSGTPGYVIGGGQTVVGLKDFDEWKRLLEAALAK